MDPKHTLRQPSPSAGTALFFITVGTLAAIWAGTWYYFLRLQEDTSPGDWRYFVCTGLFLSGVAVAIIGILVGRIGQSAQQADTPVGEVTAAAVKPTGVAGTASQVAPQPAVPVNAVPAPVQPIHQPVPHTFPRS